MKPLSAEFLHTLLAAGGGRPGEDVDGMLPVLVNEGGDRTLGYRAQPEFIPAPILV